MAEPQNDPQGLGNGAFPGSSDATGDQLPERFQGMSAAEIAQQFMDYEQQANPAMEIYRRAEALGGYDALENAYTQTYNENQQYRQYLQSLQQQQPAQHQQPAQSTEDWTSQWDYLSPQEQAQRLASQTMNSIQPVASQLAAQIREELRQEIQAEQAKQRREFDVFRAVLDQQRADPEVDPRALLQETVNLAQATPDQLMAIAAQVLGDRNGKREQEIKRLAAEQYEKMKADWEEEQRNQQLAAVTDEGGASVFSQFQRKEDGSPTTRRDVEARVRERLLRDPNSGLTAAHFVT